MNAEQCGSGSTALMKYDLSKILLIKSSPQLQQSVCNPVQLIRVRNLFIGLKYRAGFKT